MDTNLPDRMDKNGITRKRGRPPKPRDLHHDFSGIICPWCGHRKHTTRATYDLRKDLGIRRRIRLCSRCNRTFTTSEVAD